MCLDATGQDELPGSVDDALGVAELPAYRRNSAVADADVGLECLERVRNGTAGDEQIEFRNNFV